MFVKTWNVGAAECGSGLWGCGVNFADAKDAASTYRLCPHLGTWCVLKFGGARGWDAGRLRERTREREEFRCGVILGSS